MDDTIGPQPLKLTAYVGVPSNSSYLSCVKNCPTFKTPMDGSTVGIMMLLSTLQYQAPYMNPVYANAAGQAGKAAFIQVGGQDVQNKLTSKAESQAKDTIHAIGITDTELGVVLGTAKIVRDKQVDVNGPKIYFIRTHISVGQDHANLGLGFSF